MGEQFTQAALTDHHSAPVDDALKATLTFLEKLTLTPEDIAASDFAALTALGLSRQAVADAIQVCVLFNLIDRVADTLDFHVPGDEVFAKMAAPLLKMGYRF